MSKPKTRFSASIDGIQRELFSIEERNDRSLIIFSGTPRYCEYVDGVLTEFAEQHYSVHRTNGGRDTCITQKTLLSDGTSLSNVAYIHDTENYLLWTIYARRIPIMQGQTRLLRPHNKDKVLMISEFSYSTANLLYSVFVTKRGFNIAPDQAGFGATVVSFSEFKVIVIPVYLNLPSINEGDVFGLTTTPTVINNEFSADHFQLETNSIPANEFWNTHWSLMGMLRDKMLARLQVILEPNRLAFVTKMAEGFTGAPLVGELAMTDEAFKARGAKFLDSAQGIMQDYTNALRCKDWNIAVMCAQQAVELLIRGAIYLTGNRANHRHLAEAVDQLRKMFETNGTQVTEYNTSSQFPIQLQVPFADDINSGHALQLYGRQVSLLKKENGGRKLVWEHTLPDKDMKLTVYHEQNRGGYIIVTSGSKVVLKFNELGGEFLYSNDLRAPVYLSTEAWDLMLKTTKILDKQREPSFYYENSFSELDAKEAGERMKLVYSMVKKIMGGPRFEWEPPIP